MAGTFAHIILVDSLCKQLDSIPDLPPSIQLALENYTPFCKFGAVGPDYSQGHWWKSLNKLP